LDIPCVVRRADINSLAKACQPAFYACFLGDELDVMQGGDFVVSITFLRSRFPAPLRRQ